MDTEIGQQIRDEVKDYYGQLLQSSKDLKTSACTIKGSSSQRKKIADIQKLVHPKVGEKYYGCGLVAPDLLEGQYILDLGSGSGMDCYVLSKLVGPKGFVTGVDMTEEQLQVARQYIDYHREVFGYESANTKFVNGYIEDLKAAGIKDESQNLIVSNCVVNLAPDKKTVLQEAYRVLKPGGELYFSDVYSNKTISEDLRRNKILWGECISGALQWEELHNVAAEVGFCTPILFESSEMTVDNEDLQKLCAGLQFVSATYRLFKLDENEGSGCADVTYKGGISKQEEPFKFAHNMTFKKGCPLSVPVEVANILMQSRFNPFFDVGKLQKTESKIPLVIDPFQPGVAAESSGGCCGAKSKKCC